MSPYVNNNLNLCQEPGPEMSAFAGECPRNVDLVPWTKILDQGLFLLSLFTFLFLGITGTGMTLGKG